MKMELVFIGLVLVAIVIELVVIVHFILKFW